MVEVTVLKRFYDLVERVDREVGERFEVDDERATHLDFVLPGYVSLSLRYDKEPVEAERPSDEPQEDYSKLSVARLKELCAERGIKVPSGARKAQIVSLLKE